MRHLFSIAESYYFSQIMSLESLLYQLLKQRPCLMLISWGHNMFIACVKTSEMVRQQGIESWNVYSIMEEQCRKKQGEDVIFSGKPEETSMIEIDSICDVIKSLTAVKTVTKIS